MPVLAVWLDWALYFVAGSRNRKARNLALNPECVVTVEVDDAHLVSEGPAATLRDEATLHPIARAYACKYGWSVRVQDKRLWVTVLRLPGHRLMTSTSWRPRQSSRLALRNRSVRPDGAFELDISMQRKLTRIPKSLTGDYRTTVIPRPR